MAAQATATTVSLLPWRIFWRKFCGLALISGAEDRGRGIAHALFHPAPALGAPVESASPPRTARRRTLLGARRWGLEWFDWYAAAQGKQIWSRKHTILAHLT